MVCFATAIYHEIINMDITLIDEEREEKIKKLKIKMKCISLRTKYKNF